MSSTYFNSGVSFYNQREFSKAIQAYQKVIELDPTYVEAYNNLGIIYQMMGDVDRAFEAYQKSTEINPRYEKGYNNLGILLLLKGRYEEALEAFQKALGHQSPITSKVISTSGSFLRKKASGRRRSNLIRELLPSTRFTEKLITILHCFMNNWKTWNWRFSHYQQFIQLSSKSHPELVSKVQRHLNALDEARRNKK